jgi:hypothetical protein
MIRDHPSKTNPVPHPRAETRRRRGLLQVSPSGPDGDQILLAAHIQ